MNRSKPIGHLIEDPVLVARRIGKRMDSMNDCSVRECIVWTVDGCIYAARSDSMSAMYAENRTGLIGVYMAKVTKRGAASETLVDLIADDVREEQRLRGIGMAA